jgi:hypothetical protein
MAYSGQCSNCRRGNPKEKERGEKPPPLMYYEMDTKVRILNSKKEHFLNMLWSWEDWFLSVFKYIDYVIIHLHKLIIFRVD